MRVFVFMPAFAIIAACAQSFSVPVTGVIGNEPAQGHATAKFDGNGEFKVSTLDGLNCFGNYDSITTKPTISADVACDDGRVGRAIITRTMDMLSGTVIAKLEDGTEGKFVFGNLTFSQAFGENMTTVQAIR